MWPQLTKTVYVLLRPNKTESTVHTRNSQVLLCLALSLCFVSTSVIGAIPLKILTALPLIHGKAHGRTPIAAATVHGSSGPTSARLCNRAAPRCVLKVSKVHASSKVKHQSNPRANKYLWFPIQHHAGVFVALAALAARELVPMSSLNGNSHSGPKRNVSKRARPVCLIIPYVVCRTFTTLAQHVSATLKRTKDTVCNTKSLRMSTMRTGSQRHARRSGALPAAAPCVRV